MKRSKRFNHYILTRYNTQVDGKGLMLYDKPGADVWMKERGELFEETKKSVLSQEGEFQWVISVDERTPKRFLNKIKTDKRIIFTNADIRDVFLSGEIIPDRNWVITTRLDNDDRYLPGAVLAIQAAHEKKLKVIDIDYEQLDLKTGKRYTSERRWATSMFLSLCEPSNRVLTAFCRTHGQVGSEYPAGNLTDTYPAGDRLIPIHSYKIRKVYAYMVIHGDNLANKITGKPV